MKLASLIFKYRRPLIWLGSGFLILATIITWWSVSKWLFSYQHPRLPVSLKLASQERFFDLASSSYGEPYASHASFEYDGDAQPDGNYKVDGIFDVRKLDGSPIFSAKQQYKMENWSGRVTEVDGREVSNQYLLFPRFAFFKNELSLRYIGHDKPITMRHIGFEATNGILTAHYRGVVSLDKSVNFSFALKDGQGMRVEATIDAWVEPITGSIINFIDAGTDIIYNKATGEDIGPWNTFTNSQTVASSAVSVSRAEAEQAALVMYFALIPLAFIALVIAIWMLIRRRMTAKELPWEIPEDRWRRISMPLWRIVPALLAAGISATGVYVTWRNELLRIDQKHALESTAAEAALRDDITDTLQQDLAAIRAAVGFIKGSENVTPDEWNRFVVELDVERNTSGMQALGYAQPITDAQKINAPAGLFGAKGIWPESSRDLYIPITRIAPENPENISVLGFDFASEPNRHAAVMAARDSGEPRMTGKIVLKQDATKAAQPGFLIVQAVYSGQPKTIDERQNSVIGYVYGAFRAGDIVATAIDDNNNRNNLSIFDTASATSASEINALYGPTSSQLTISSTETIELFGRPWTFVNYRHKSVEPTAYIIANLIVIGGGSATVFIFLIVYLLSTSRFKALNYAREANRRITEDAKKLQTLLDTLPVGVFVMDAATKEPILLNKAGQKITAKKSLQFIPAEDYPSVYGLVTSEGKPFPAERLPNFVCAQSGKPVAADDIYLARPDGTKVALQVQAVPVLRDDKTVSQVISVFTDVTAQRELEQQRKEFLSIASHQLRTPLTAIKWFTELLATGVAGKLRPMQAEYVQQAGDSAARMIRLVNDLLDVSRIESGKIEPRIAPTDLAAISRSILTETRPLLREKRLVVKTAIPKKALISTDERYVRQVAINLVSNAIKYSKQRGKINLAVSVKPEHVEFRISDDGIGIPPAQRPQIFRKFFRADNAAQSSVDGTGLGLYVCKSLIEKLGGKIWFESEENKGSTFTFILPRRK